MVGEKNHTDGDCDLENHELNLMLTRLFISIIRMLMSIRLMKTKLQLSSHNIVRRARQGGTRTSQRRKQTKSISKRNTN